MSSSNDPLVWVFMRLRSKIERLFIRETAPIAQQSVASDFVVVYRGIICCFIVLEYNCFQFFNMCVYIVGILWVEVDEDYFSSHCIYSKCSIFGH